MSKHGALLYTKMLLNIAKETNMKMRIVALNELCRLIGIEEEAPKQVPTFGEDPNTAIYIRLSCRVHARLGESFAHAYNFLTAQTENWLHYSPCRLHRNLDNTGTIMVHGMDAVRHWKLGDEMFEATCDCGETRTKLD